MDFAYRDRAKYLGDQTILNTSRFTYIKKYAEGIFQLIQEKKSP